MGKLICYGVFMGLGYCGTVYAADLWVVKNGFWWGLAISVFFDFCISLVSGASRLAFLGLTKNGEVNGFFCRILSMIFAIAAFYVGYRVLLIGWSIWWTGFWASLLIGAPGLFIGACLFIFSPIHLFLTVLPRSLWGRFVK